MKKSIIITKSQLTKLFGSLAQLGEHLPYKQRVIGSSPIATTMFYGPVVQLVRTLACHARGRRFEPVPGRHLLKGEFRLLGPLGVEIPLCTLGYRKRFAQIAQLVEQWTENPRVAGSIPALGTNMREWLSGRASPCQGEGREFESRLALLISTKQYQLKSEYARVAQW